ncbi:MAG: hypothetical protein KBT11_07595 [Treponema sp.]|nr:hypothetical protein [Candidatus Treponema equifaecale]
MTKQEFVTASINVCKYYFGVNLPLTVDNIMEKEDCINFFYFELPSSYEDDDDNEIECTFWYSVSNYKDVASEEHIEVATGIDGRSGDHFFIKFQDWLESRDTKQ